MFLSIITVNFNNKKGLIQTIETVVNQECKDFEWIIVDGGSTDGSVEVIQDHIKHVDFWVSELDQGVYDAMNKGIKVATGDYILFLNSGDYFYTNEATKIINSLESNTDFIIYDYIKKTCSGNELIRQHAAPRSHLISGMFCHQSVLHKRYMFDKIGLYDTSYKIAADYAFFLKGFFQYNATYSYVNEALILYDDTEGISDYNCLTEKTYINEKCKAQKGVFTPELVDEFAERQKRINDLNQIKSLYQGLLNSKLIQITMNIIRVKKNIFEKKAI